MVVVKYLITCQRIPNELCRCVWVRRWKNPVWCFVWGLTVDLNCTSVCSKSFLCLDWSCQNCWLTKLWGHELAGSEFPRCRVYGNWVVLWGLPEQISGSPSLFNGRTLCNNIFITQTLCQRSIWKVTLCSFRSVLLISQEGSLVWQYDFFFKCFFLLQMVYSKYCQTYLIQRGKPKMTQVLTNLQLYKSVFHPQRNFLFWKRYFLHNYYSLWSHTMFAFFR